MNGIDLSQQEVRGLLSLHSHRSLRDVLQAVGSTKVADRFPTLLADAVARDFPLHEIRDCCDDWGRFFKPEHLDWHLIKPAVAADLNVDGPSLTACLREAQLSTEAGFEPPDDADELERLAMLHIEILRLQGRPSNASLQGPPVEGSEPLNLAVLQQRRQRLLTQVSPL